MFVELGDLFEGLVVVVDGKVGGPTVRTEASNGPDDVPSLRAERRVGTFGVESGAAIDGDSRRNRPVVLVQE